MQYPAGLTYSKGTYMCVAVVVRRLGALAYVCWTGNLITKQNKLVVDESVLCLRSSQYFGYGPVSSLLDTSLRFLVYNFRFQPWHKNAMAAMAYSTTGESHQHPSHVPWISVFFSFSILYILFHVLTCRGWAVSRNAHPHPPGPFNESALPATHTLGISWRNNLCAH